MMKKKLKDQEEINKNASDKSTENKENINYPENGGTGKVEKSDSGDSEAEEEEALEGTEAVSDKMIPELKAAEEKLAEMQDKYIRLSAEFDNFRRRTLREKMDLSKYAGENLFLGIIPLMDDFERALKHIEETSTDCTGMKAGIDIIYVKFNDFLKQNGVKEIDSLGTDFNVDLHEAIAKVPADDPDKKGKVIDVVQKGYYLQDKVLRFAKVVVGE